MPDATRFVAAALGAAPSGELGHACGFCGSSEPGYPAEQVLKENFTNRDELTSPWVCWACSACLDARETRSAHLVTAPSLEIAGDFRRVERKEVWRLLINPPLPPFVLYLTLAGQKHGLFRQEVATSRDAFRVQAEDLSGWYVRAEWDQRMLAAVALRKLGVRRESLETGRYDSSDHLKARSGIAAFEALVKAVRPTQLFTVILGTMPGKEDLWLYP